MEPATILEQHECDLCHKAYRRRDLLVRHRRRCTPNKASSKKKSCSACVQARSRCSLVQPKCTRCEKRDLVCEYAISDPQYSVSTSPISASTGLSVIDNALESASARNSEACPNPWSVNTMNSIQGDSNQTTQTLLADGAESLYWSMSDLPPLNGFIGEVSALNDPSIAPALQAEEVLRSLREYSISLTLDDYHTPLLHRELYNIYPADITVLPKTTTAIMCALGWKTSGSHSFLKRAISAERQRLIEGFPKSSCIEEWDILHAMWLYQMMELPEVPETVDDHWKPGPRTQGLNLPILLKMTRRFSRSHPEALDPSAQMNRDALVQSATVPSAWMTWLVGETARRTVFFAHITNYFASKSPISGELSPYYEALDDELIWNMPLPCSSVAWNARTEHEWLQVLRAQDLSVGSEDQPVSLSKLFNREPTLKSLLTNFTKNYLLTQYSGRYGLDDSESLCSLLVRCALEQC